MKERSWYPLNLQPVVLYHWDSPEECSMMSSQITVWAPWIAALRDAHTAASSGLASGSFMVSDSSCPACDSSPTLPSPLSASLSSHSRFSTAGCCSKAASWRLDVWLPRWLRMLPQDPRENQEVVTSLKGELLFFFPLLLVSLSVTCTAVRFRCSELHLYVHYRRLHVRLLDVLPELNRSSVEAKAWPTYQHKLSFFSQIHQVQISLLVYLQCLGFFVVSLWTHKLHSVSVFEVRWSDLIRLSQCNKSELLPSPFVKVCLMGPRPSLPNTLSYMRRKGFLKHSLVCGWLYVMDQWIDKLRAQIKDSVAHYKSQPKIQIWFKLWEYSFVFYLN